MKTRNAMKNSNDNKPDPAEVIPNTAIEENSEYCTNETHANQSITLEILTDQLKLLRSDIAQDFSKHKDEIISHLQQENLYLKNEIENLKKDLKSKSETLVEVERDVIDLQQYIRRNNVEICGIPETVDSKNLERTVMKIADIIGVKVEERDIEACHRLVKRKNDRGPKRTIVRFVNRKYCDLLHRNKKRLSDDYSKMGHKAPENTETLDQAQGTEANTVSLLA